MALWSNERKNRVFDQGMYTLHIRGRFTNMVLGTTPGDPNILATYVASKAPDAERVAEEIARSYEGKLKEEMDLSKLMTVFPVGLFLRYDDPKHPGEPVFYDPLYDIVPADRADKVTEVKVPFMWSHQFEGAAKETIGALQRAEKGNRAKPAKAPAKKGRKKKTDPEQESIPEAAAEPVATVTEVMVEDASGDKKRFASSALIAFKKEVDLTWFIGQRRIPLLIPENYYDDLGELKETYGQPGREGMLPIFARSLRTSGPVPQVCIACSEFCPAGTEFYLTFRLLNPAHKKALIEVLDYKDRVGMLQWRSSGKGTFIWTPADAEGHPVDEMPE